MVRTGGTQSPAHATSDTTLDPKNGTYKLRRRVPEDLRRLVGGTAEVSFTLWTRDPATVAAEFRKRDAELDARWIEIREGRRGLDHEAVEVLGDVEYQDFLARTGGDCGFWVGHAHAAIHWACNLRDEAMAVELKEVWLPRLEALHGGNPDQVLKARRWSPMS